MRNGRSILLKMAIVSILLLTIAMFLPQTTSNSRATPPSENLKLLSDGQFVFGPNVGNFDLYTYLSMKAPHLLPYYNYLFFYSRYPSINPRLLLTLIELRSDLVSTPSTMQQEYTYTDPLRLPEKGFETQLKSLAEDLTRAYYSHLHQYTPLAVTTHQQLEVRLADGTLWTLPREVNAGTYALINGIGKVMNSVEFLTFIDGESPTGFHATYLRLFPGDDPLDESNKIDVLSPPPSDLLQFPFPVGDEWSFNGVHDWDGNNGGSDMSSIDFGKGWPAWGVDTSGMWVVAAAGGTITKLSDCWVSVQHMDGWSTWYYHLENVQKSTGDIGRNDRLANIANTYDEATCSGGVSSGPHVHFALLRNGAYVALNETTLSGWAVHSGRSPYDDDCNFMYLERDGQKKCTSSSVLNEPITIRLVKFIDNPWPWSWKWQIGSDDSRVTKAVVDGQLLFERPGCTWGTKWLNPGLHTLEYWYQRGGSGAPSISIDAYPYTKALCAADDGNNPVGDPTGSSDNATFTHYETYLDGASLTPNQSFIKTWGMRNSGSSTWGAGYQLCFIGGDQLGGSACVGIPNTSPGNTTNISVNMTAPASDGTYKGNWRLRNPQGTYFGDTVWVSISITGGSEATPPPSVGDAITLTCLNCLAVVAPGQTFRPTIHAIVNSGQLLQSRGDMLRNTDGNLYGAFPHIAVVGTVNVSQAFDFTFYANNPITAPSQEGAYETKWRIWRNGTWAGQEITIGFQVKNGGGTAPNPPTLSSPADWYVSQDGSTPQLCANPISGVQYYFQIYQSHDIPESGWISNNCWPPPGLGTYGYQWRVKVRATGTGLESGWSETQHFEISSQEVVYHGPSFSPGSPSAADEVGVWFCVEDQGGVEVYANTATDGSSNGEWQWIAPVVGVCNLDENDPSKWPQWHTRMQPDGTHRIRAIAWRGNRDQPGYKERIVETTYTLQRRRPSDIDLVSPDQYAWFNTRTITFRWNPQESQRINEFHFRVSTSENPAVPPIITQTLPSATRAFTYTFSQDYSVLHWWVEVCNELGCGNPAVGHFGIDRVNPGSAAKPLSAITTDTVFQVDWSGGTDNASGIRWYDVQYRDGERGSWVDWQTNVSNTVVIFIGQPGHKYFFRARALDNASNLEPYSTSANGDAFTTIDLNARPPTPWWNPAYAHKRNILVSNSVATTMVAGYPVRLHFDDNTPLRAADLYSASLSPVKGDDLRIIYNNQTELPRFIQTFRSDRIDIWFRTQADIGGLGQSATDYQLYYGNAGAANPPANIDDVMPPGKDAYTIGIWHFQEGSGSTIYDSSGSGHHAGLTSNGGGYEWGTDGQFGGFVRLWSTNNQQDGPGAWAEVSDGSAFSLGQLTVEAWVRQDVDGAERALVAKQFDNNLVAWWLSLLGNKPGFDYNYARVPAPPADIGRLTFGQWYHVAATYDGSTLRTFLNGQQINQRIETKSPLVSGGPLLFGRRTDNGNFANFLNGALQHIRISNVARTDFTYAQNLAAVTQAPSVEAGSPIDPPVSGSPDLAVLSLAAYPDPSGGVLVQATLQNTGTLPTQNGFFTDLYANHLPTGTGVYTGSIQFWVNDAIATGAIVTLTTVITDVTSLGLMSPASMAPLSESSATLYTQVDSTGVISETNNTNNIFSAGTQVCLASADTYENDDTFQTALTITLGQTQTHNIERPANQDWVKFTAQAGQSYTVRTTNLGTSADTYLYLYDSDGTTLLAANDDSEGTLASQIDWTAPANGTYYVLVQHWNPNAGGCGTTYNLTLSLAVTTAQLPLLPGWNLVSTSLLTASTSITQLLSSIGGSYNLVYAYNACDTSDPWKKYDPTAPPFVNDLTTVGVPQGLWIRVVTSATLSISGTSPGTITIQLCPGWNLIGYPSKNPVSLPSALSSIAGKYNLVYAYDANDSADPWKKYDPAAPPFVNDLTQMEMGKGYWIRATEPATLVVTAALCAPISSEETVVGSLGDATPIHSYCITGIAGQWASIRMFQFNNQTLDTSLKLYAPDGQLVAQNDNGSGIGTNSFLTYQFAPIGTYLLVATRTGSGSGAFHLRLEAGHEAAVGDINRNCVVDISDFGIFKNALNTSDQNSDLNLDGVVDSSLDLAIFQANYDLTCP